jgi:hypothetical protein
MRPEFLHIPGIAIYAAVAAAAIAVEAVIGKAGFTED